MTALLQGNRLYLRGLVEADADGAYPGWLNDPEVCAGNSHGVYPYSREGALSFIRQAGQGADRLVLAVVLKEGHRHIGNVALQNIHPIYRSAELAILMGDKGAWGKGYGLEACRLLCAHGFNVLNLNRIACGTFASNEGMIRLATALGMKQEGIRRQGAYKNGAYLDVVEFGLLKSEFTENQ